jgi:hypothetical protein
MSDHPLQDLFNLYDGGKLPSQNDEQLRCLHNVCVNCQGNDLHSRTKAEHIARVIEELIRANGEKKRHDALIAEQQRLHGQATGQAATLHQETKSDLGEIKTLVGNLAKPRWIDWVIVIVGTIAAIAAVISLFLKH